MANLIQKVKLKAEEPEPPKKPPQSRTSPRPSQLSQPKQAVPPNNSDLPPTEPKPKKSSYQKDNALSSNVPHASKPNPGSPGLKHIPKPAISSPKPPSRLQSSDPESNTRLNDDHNNKQPDISINPYQTEEITTDDRATGNSPNISPLYSLTHHRFTQKLYSPASQ